MSNDNTEVVNDVSAQPQEIVSNEIWAPVPEYEGLYEVSNHGSVRSLDRTIQVENAHVGYKYSYAVPGKLLSIRRNRNSAQFVRLQSGGTRKTKRVARLVAEAFVKGHKPDYIVGFKDSNRDNLHADNLKWVPRKETASAVEGDNNA